MVVCSVILSVRGSSLADVWLLWFCTVLTQSKMNANSAQFPKGRAQKCCCSLLDSADSVLCIPAHACMYVCIYLSIYLHEYMHVYLHVYIR